MEVLGGSLSHPLIADILAGQELVVLVAKYGNSGKQQAAELKLLSSPGLGLHFVEMEPNPNRHYQLQANT